MSAVLPWVVDVLAVAGALLSTVAVYGIAAMPSTLLKVHAATTGVFLGLIPLLAAAALSGDAAVAMRALLIAVLLLLTAPISAHAITKAAHQRENDGPS